MISNFQFHKTSSKWQTQVPEMHDGRTDLLEVTMQKGKEVEGDKVGEDKIGEEEDVESRVGRVQFNQTLNALNERW